MIESINKMITGTSRNGKGDFAGFSAGITRSGCDLHGNSQKKQGGDLKGEDETSKKDFCLPPSTSNNLYIFLYINTDEYSALALPKTRRKCFRRISRVSRPAQKFSTGGSCEN